MRRMLISAALVGTIRNGVIEGTYTSNHVQTGRITGGTWRAVRKQSWRETET